MSLRCVGQSPWEITWVPVQDPPFNKRMFPVYGSVIIADTLTVGGVPGEVTLMATDGE